MSAHVVVLMVAIEKFPDHDRTHLTVSEDRGLAMLGMLHVLDALRNGHPEITEEAFAIFQKLGVPLPENPAARTS